MRVSGNKECLPGKARFMALRRVIYPPGQRPGFSTFRLGPAKLYIDDIEVIHKTLLEAAEKRKPELAEGESASVVITAGEATADVPDDLSEARVEELRRIRLTLNNPVIVVELCYPLQSRVSAMDSDADGRAVAEGIRDYVNGRSRWYSGLRPVRSLWDGLMLVGGLGIVVGFLIQAQSLGSWLAYLLFVFGAIVVLSSANCYLAYRHGAIRIISRRERENRSLSVEARRQLAIAIVGAIAGALILGVAGLWAGMFVLH
jgi:hypothetical protein